MSAGIYKIEVEQGATFTLPLTWKINANPVNVTGYTARLQVRTDGSGRVPSNILILSITSDDNITLGGSDGSIEVYLSPNDTAALAQGRYTYDLELEAPNGRVTRLIKGQFIVNAEVTR